MSDSERHPPMPQRTWKRKILGVVAFLFFTIGLVLLIFYLRFANPEYVRAKAESYMQQFTNGRVQVASADFTWLGGVQLYDVVVRDADRSGGKSTSVDSIETGEVVFSCRDLRLDANLLWGVLGKLRIRSVVAEQPTCLIVRRASDGSTNLTDLLKWGSGEHTQERLTLPTIELREAHVRVVHRKNDRDRVVDRQTLTVRGRPSKTDPRFYDIVWRGGGDRRAQGHSQVDVQSGRLRNIKGGLPWMSLEAVMTVVNAQIPEVGAWSDLLGLKGAVRATDYDLSGGAGHDEPRSATVELENATLSIPITDDDDELPLDHRYLHFERVFGSITLTSDDIEARFRADFHGSQCDVSLTMKGAVGEINSLDDVDFNAKVTAENLLLPRDAPESHPEEFRFVQRWTPIKKFYRDFQPSGVVDLELEVAKRAGVNVPIETKHIRLIARNVDSTHRKFPYIVQGLQGVVDFTPDGVFLKDIRGSHGDGRVTASGWLSAPRRHAALDLKFTGEDIAIEEALITALPPRYRRFYDLFSPTGRIDTTVRVTREEGEENATRKSLVSTDVKFVDLDATYSGFPVPANDLGGELYIDGKSLEVRDLAGTMAGGRVQVSGHAKFSKGTSPDLNLRIAGQGLAFTKLILKALPEKTRKWVAQFHPAGKFGFDLALASKGDDISHDASIQLEGMSVSSEKLPIPVTDVRGTLRLTDGRIEADALTGKYRNATIVASVSMAAAGGSAEDLIRITCADLLIDETVRAAVPDGIRNFLETWRVRTPLDATVTVRRGPAGEAGWNDVRVEARLQGATVEHDQFPLPFEQVSAKVTVDGKTVNGTDIRASYGDAVVRVSFQTSRHGGAEEGRINVDTSGLTLNSTFRDVFPGNVRRAWDRLGLSGAMDIHLHPLVYRRTAPDAPTVWTAAGRMVLSNVNLTRVDAIGNIHGTFVVDGTLVDRMGGMMVGGKFEDGRLTIFDRAVTDVSTPWTHVQAAGGEGQFLLNDICGKMYDGSFTARTEIHFDDQDTRYDVSGALHGVDIKEVLAADRKGSTVRRSKHTVAGLADASLTLVGTVGKPPSRKGTGRIELRDAQLFRMPLMSAVLNVINLTLPSGEFTDEAAASFYVLGSRLKLTDIYIKGHGMAFRGAGTYSLPDKGLDLNLVYENPNQNVRVPGLSDAVENALGNLVEMRVTGPLHQPRVVPRALPGISDELKHLFKKKEQKKMQATSR